MAYNYLDLTNAICNEVGEVELTETNFAGVIGQHAQIKRAINSAIREINSTNILWSFNHTAAEITLVDGQTRYDFPANTKVVDFYSFRLKNDGTILTDTYPLRLINYKDYLKFHADEEYNTTKEDRPRYVFRTPEGGYGLSPTPDRAYTLAFDYFLLPTDLVLFSDVPTVPEDQRQVIEDGAMKRVLRFRRDNEGYQMAVADFDRGMRSMRTIYNNRNYDKIGSSMLWDVGGGHLYTGERVT